MINPAPMIAGMIRATGSAYTNLTTGTTTRMLVNPQQSAQLLAATGTAAKRGDLLRDSSGHHLLVTQTQTNTTCLYINIYPADHILTLPDGGTTHAALDSTTTAPTSAASVAAGGRPADVHVYVVPSSIPISVGDTITTATGTVRVRRTNIDDGLTRLEVVTNQ